MAVWLFDVGHGAFMRLLQRPELTGCLSHEGSAGKLGCITFEDLRCKLSVAFVQDGAAQHESSAVLWLALKKDFNQELCKKNEQRWFLWAAGLQLVEFLALHVLPHSLKEALTSRGEQWEPKVITTPTILPRH